MGVSDGKRPSPPARPAPSTDERKSDLPIIRPKLGGPVWNQRVPKLSGRGLFGTSSGPDQRSSGRSRRGGHPLRGRQPLDVKTAGPTSRRAVVKAHVRKMDSSGGVRAAADHVRYIERDGVEKDGSKGALYGPSGEVDSAQFVERSRKDPHQFRFIISPEDSGEIDLQDFTRRLVEKMEADLGRKLDWCASNHYNTDNPHTHLIVRGTDREGHYLHIDRDYIANGVRNRARELATLELGPRALREVETELLRARVQERFTNLDRALAAQLSTEHRLDLGKYQPPPGPNRMRTHLVARLGTLERLGLAQRRSSTSWQLEPVWEARLRALGARNDILATIHRAIAGDSSRYRVLDGDAEMAPCNFVGVVRRKGLHAELEDTQYAVIETAKGDAYYVPLAPSAAALKEGDLASVTVAPDSWLKEADREIFRVAAGHARVYSREAHLAHLEDHSGSRQHSDPERFVEAHLKRLSRLARYRLATREQDGRWSIPDNFLEQLREREKTHPRNRVDVRAETLTLAQQVSHEGPTWLDDAVGAGTTGDYLASYGFGAELREASARRRRFLLDRGVPLEGPAQVEALANLERDTVGRALARERGATYVEEPGRDRPYEGRVVDSRALPSGRRYVLVQDEMRGVLSLVRETPELRARLGQMVELSRAANGLPQVRSPDRARG